MLKKTAFFIGFIIFSLYLFADSETVKNPKKRFFGSVKGEVNTTITNDYGAKKTFGLSGLKVQLLRKYGGKYYNFGETFTDETGKFLIPVNKTKKGNKVKLYLRVYASTDPSYKIQSKKSGTIYKYDQLLGEFGTDVGNVETSLSINHKYSDAFRSVHWARKGLLYFRNNDVPLAGGLTIKINRLGSWSNSNGLQKYPKIFLKKNDGNNENTIYHEFGHYTMYRLQNKKMRIPFGEKGINNHGWRTENNGLLSWTEAWANAVMMILDAAHWREDDEYGLRKKGIYYELLERTGTINNGFRSEYLIANAIYDLWDGPDKGLPDTLKNGNNRTHGWNDTGEKFGSFYYWKTIDDVSLPLAQICAPLQKVKKRADLKNLRNVNQYYQALISQFKDCKEKADIKRVFIENRVLWNIRDYESKYITGNLSTDDFFETKTVKEKGFLRMEIPFIFSKWKDNYQINIPFNENSYTLYAEKNSSLALIDDYWIGIDEYNRNKTVYIYLNPSINKEKTNLTHGNFYTCGGNQILIRNGGLELGNPNSKYTADLTISENSLLSVEKKGNLTLNNNCTLHIEAGGTLIIKSQSTVTMLGNATIVVEKGGDITVEEGANIIGEGIVIK